MIGVATAGVMVATTSNGGHDAEFYADRLVDRLIFVSQNAPEPIRAQALVYKDAMRKLILAGLKDAVRSSRSTLAVELDQVGMKDAATYVRHMKD